MKRNTYLLQALIIMSFTNFSVSADNDGGRQKHFTWVDENGVVRTTVVPIKVPTVVPTIETPTAKVPTNGVPATDGNHLNDDSDTEVVTTESSQATDAEIFLLPNSNEEFLSEEAFEKIIEKERQQKPEFYIWVDENGRVITEAKPTSDGIDVSSETIEEAIQYDDMWNFKNRITLPDNGVKCCKPYSGYFQLAKKPNKSYEYPDPSRYPAFKANSAEYPAWYVDISDGESEDAADNRQLILRYRGSPMTISVIGVDDNRSPVHFSKSISYTEFDETWSRVAYRESRIKIDDPEVVGIIAYVVDNDTGPISLEVRWY